MDTWSVALLGIALCMILSLYFSDLLRVGLVDGSVGDTACSQQQCFIPVLGSVCVVSLYVLTVLTWVSSHSTKNSIK